MSLSCYGPQSTNDPFASSIIDLMSDPIAAFMRDPKMNQMAQMDMLMREMVPMNVSENADRYKVTTEVPGFTKDQISLDVNGNMLILKGERKDESSSRDESNIRVERRRMSKFERSLRLPNDVDPKKIKASLNHGILDIQIDKTGAQAGKRTAIKVQ
jgi:HSP20 family molecular chaperone IbpA